MSERNVPVKFTTNNFVSLTDSDKQSIGTQVIIRCRDFVEEVAITGGNFRVTFDKIDSFNVSIENVSEDLQKRFNSYFSNKPS